MVFSFFTCVFPTASASGLNCFSLPSGYPPVYYQVDVGMHLLLFAVSKQYILNR